MSESGFWVNCHHWDRQVNTEIMIHGKVHRPERKRIKKYMFCELLKCGSTFWL